MLDTRHSLKKYTQKGRSIVLPDFLVIGAPRSGTTWIAKNLSAHPDIFVPVQKELHFFDRDGEYAKGIDEYASHFERRGDARIAGEATPAYLHHPAAAERIREHLPGRKLIACLRDPAERLYSRYWNARGRFKSNEGKSFETKIREKPELVQEGYYADHLRRYFGLFDRQLIEIFFFEQIAAEPEALLRRMYHFLGVDPDFVPVVATHKINASSNQKLVVKSRPIFLLTKLLRRMKANGIAQAVERSNAGSIPQLSRETRSWLISEFYAKKNNELQDLLNVDLRHWNQP